MTSKIFQRLYQKSIISDINSQYIQKQHKKASVPYRCFFPSDKSGPIGSVCRKDHQQVFTEYLFDGLI